MRVFSRAAVLLALGAVAVTPSARAQVVVGPMPASMAAVPGASITVPVVADLTSSGGASLGSIALRLTWRPATLAYVSTEAGTLGAPTVNADSASAGILKVAVANAVGATGLPVLFNAAFTVTGAAADTAVLRLSVSEITAAHTFADLKPNTVTTAAQFCAAGGVFGDVDDDATFTAHDALIILTNAVGLPVTPFSVVNGDVDGNAVVDTRDALIVLSAAVGIPVTQFRIGHLATGACSLRSAASVQIQPRTPTVATGDSLPVTATVRDSTGALVQGIGLVWQSKDPTIVRPGAAGSLVAIAPGSTYATVIVQPGVKDSVPVVVTAARHVWYVNPAVAAANLGAELGSQVYPFSTIDTALARAGANDTIHVATATYGPVSIAQPLVLLGDSSAGGFPRLTSIAGPAIRVDTVAGSVVIRGFRLLNSFKGLVATLVHTLELGSVSVEGARDLGIRVYGADSVLLAHSSVVGAVAEGIELDSLRATVLDHVRSDAIAAAENAAAPPVALRIARAATVSGDSITLGTAGALVDSAGAVTLRRIRVTGAQGPALLVNGSAATIVGGDFSRGGMFRGAAPVSYDPMSYAVSLSVSPGAIRFDSSKVHDNGTFGVNVDGVPTTVSLRADTVARNYSGSTDDATSSIYGFGWLRMAQSAFLNNGLGYVDIEGSGADSVTADSTVFDGNYSYVYYVAAFRMHGGAIRHSSAPALEADYASAVELDSVEVSGNNILYNGFNPAVYVYYADTVTVNGMNAHDNASAALGVYYGTALRVAGGSMLNNGFGQTGDERYTIGAYYVNDTRIYGLMLRDSTDVGVLVFSSGASRTAVDSSFLEGSGALVRGWSSCCSTHGDTLIVSRSSLTGFGGTSVYGVDVQWFTKLALTGSFLDSLAGNAVQTYGVDTTIAAHNTIRAWGGSGITVNYGALTADTNTFAGCVPFGEAIYAYQPGTTSVVGNTLNGCGSLIYAVGPYASSGPDVRVFANTLTRDTTTSLPGILLVNGLGYVQVAGNSILGGGSEGINIGANYGVDSVRVDSNTVQQTLNNAIDVTHVTYGVLLRYNLVADAMGYGMLMGSPFTARYNTAVRNHLGGVADSTAGPSSFRLGNIVGNLPYGVTTLASSMQADSNWWGRSQGPKCVGVCDQTVTPAGDSISGSVSFTPVVSTGAVAGAPAIPVPPGAPVVRSLAAWAAVAPRGPKAPPGVQNVGTAPRAATQAAPQPVAPRGVRPTGRPTGHHKPVWKTGVPR